MLLFIIAYDTIANKSYVYIISKGELLIMTTNDYFEMLNFNNGEKIKISNKVDMSFSHKMHWHPYIEILVSLCDNKATINFIEYTLKANDLVVVYPGYLHSLDCECENSFILVQLPIDLLLILNEFKSKYPIFCQYCCIKYDPTDIDCDRMVFIIKELSDLYYSDSPFKEVRIYSHLLDFFIMFVQHCINTKKDNSIGNVDAKYKFTKLMAEACLYISKNCTEPLTLENISNHIGVSKFHFSHLFKEYTNMTFIDFLTAERIKRAEALISYPKAHITDIAFDSGFSSVSSFNRSFKKIKGMSPSEFREAMINK